MKWKSDFMKSATGQLGVFSDDERKKRLIYYVECLDNLLDAIEADDVINKNWLEMHIKWLDEELSEINNLE